MYCYDIYSVSAPVSQVKFASTTSLVDKVVEAKDDLIRF